MRYNQPALRGLFALSAASLIATQSGVRQVNYVLIGAGPAGLVIAEKLSQNPQVTVTLLEAGKDGSNDPLVNVPAYFVEAQPNMFQYNSQPDPNIGGRTPNLWQGAILGGGAGVNAMIYCRGAASVFDEWAEISGNSGLAWESIYEDYKATTHYVNQTFNYTQVVTPDAFGNGPLEISRGEILVSFDEPFADELKSTLGMQEIDMMNGTAIGVSLGLETIQVSNHTRSYGLNTYGYLMTNRPNFQLIHNAFVQKIGFSGTTATDVTYTNTLTNETYTINAKEVIVTAGAIKTPQLLMLSGVGPKDQLSKLNIPVVADIPGVGSNLYDHHYSVAEYQAIDSVETMWQWSENATEAAIANASYAANGSGPLGRNNGDVYGGVRLPDSVFEGINGTHFLSLPDDRPQLIYEYATTPFLGPKPNVSIIAAFVALVQPEATGYVTINTTDYLAAPLIYSNYYGSDGDKAAITYGYKQLRSIMTSDNLKPFLEQEIFPGTNVTTDEEVWQAIQTSASSWHHALGTVALGTVLDSNWRIKGLNGIRVVGSAAFPKPPTCALQATAYALSHRAAQDIATADGVDV